MEFFRRTARANPAAFEARRVLEAGSLDVNGSVRAFFTAAEEYVGVDWRPGKGVDEVCLFHEYRGRPDGYFDVVVSTEMLEHDPHWGRSLRRMMELLSNGGVLIVTCAGPGRRPHRHDTSPARGYYRNLSMGDVAGAVLAAGHFKTVRLEYDDQANDTRFFGWRKACQTSAS